MFSLRPSTRSLAAFPKPRPLHVSRHTPLFKPWPRPATFATKSAAPVKPKRRTGLYITGGVIVVGAAYLQYTEGGRKFAGAAARTNRVVSTLAVCVNDYWWTLRKHDTVDAVEYRQILKDCHQRCANRTLKAMEKNGSIFIKLGQHLTSLNYMLPVEWCDTFIPLQDKCPVSSFESIKEMVYKDTGKSIDDLFTTFESQPIGSASLAQVHRAVDKASGRHVAVKVQHPELDDWAPLDLALTRLTFSTLKWAFPEYDLTWLSDEMEVSLPQELNFELEGTNALRTKAYFAKIPSIPLVIPDVLWAQRRIVCMEFMTGHRIDDLPFLDRSNISRDEVAASLARIFNTMIFAPDAPLHCDPHGGNIAIVANGHRSYPHNFDIILYDHGLYRVLERGLQRSYAKLWLAVLDADESRMRKYAKEVAGITDEQFPLFASAITGRDYRVIADGVDRTPRSDEEKEAISDSLGEGMLQQLVQLLGQVPRVILLVLKTNDLTRSLDASLQTTQGPIRSFLILAQYAAHTVWQEQVELLRASGGLLWPPRNAIKAVTAWLGYARIVGRLNLYEWYLWVRGKMGNPVPAPEPPQLMQ